MQLRWSGHLVRMDDERLPKRLFYGDVATGSRRQGGQIRRYKDTLKSSLKRLQINSTNWEELAHERPTWRRTVKTGAAIYEANRIAAAKVKRKARKSQAQPVRNADAQPLPTCPRCQRTFRDRIGLVGHLRINCVSRTASTIVPPPASSSSSLPLTNSDSSSSPSLFQQRASSTSKQLINRQLCDNHPGISLLNVAEKIATRSVSEAFVVNNGVKQGCVLAPTLFSLMLSAMLMDAYRDERPPGSASPTGRTTFSSSGGETNVSGTQLQVAENFMYVGSTLSYSIKIDDEVDRRISKVVFKMQFGIVTGFTSAPNLEMHKAVNLSPIGPTAAHGLHPPSSLLLSLPRLPRREASTYSQIRFLHRCLDRNVNRPTEPPLTSSSSSSSSSSTSADVASGMPINTIKKS
ncbi:hypothetical protein SprV_1002808700 [Sparganum proliferum]